MPYKGPLQRKLKGGAVRQKEQTTHQNGITVYLSKIISLIHHLHLKDCGLCNLFAMIQGFYRSSISVTILLLNDSIISNDFLRYISEFIFYFIFFFPPRKVERNGKLGGICSKVKGV